MNYGGRIAIGCPELHQIADVDQNGARNRHGRNPFGAGKHLQSANVVLEEQRERAVVGMLSATLDSGRCRWVGRIQRRIEQSAECGAVLVAAVAHHPVPFRKEILRQTFLKNAEFDLREKGGSLFCGKFLREFRGKCGKCGKIPDGCT